MAMNLTRINHRNRSKRENVEGYELFWSNRRQLIRSHDHTIFWLHLCSWQLQCQRLVLTYGSLVSTKNATNESKNCVPNSCGVGGRKKKKSLHAFECCLFVYRSPIARWLSVNVVNKTLLDNVHGQVLFELETSHRLESSFDVAETLTPSASQSLSVGLLVFVISCCCVCVSASWSLLNLDPSHDPLTTLWTVLRDRFVCGFRSSTFITGNQVGTWKEQDVATTILADGTDEILIVEKLWRRRRSGRRGTTIRNSWRRRRRRRLRRW